MSDIVTRLRTTADEFQPKDWSCDICEEAADEIERLREFVKFLNSFRPDAELAKRDAEIERLRLEVLFRDTEVRAKADEIDRLRSAFEQERHDCINLTEKVIPNLRVEIDGVKYGMAYEQSRNETLQAEIERLRGLLREIGDIGWLQAPHPLTKRVREAIGD